MRPGLTFGLLFCLMGGAVGAQTLARPGWAGSGVTVEPWWKRGVLYRIDPARFQDSDGDGKGDLAGVRQRLVYLQSLGVDGLVLENLKVVQGEPDGFDDLAREASGYQLRVLVEIGAPAAPPEDTDGYYLGAARYWLNQGAAGLYVDTRALVAATSDDRAARLLKGLRALTDSFPGGRVLLADAAPADHTALVKPLSQAAAMVASAAIPGTSLDAAGMRAEWLAAMAGATTSSGSVAATGSGAGAVSGRRHGRTVGNVAPAVQLAAAGATAVKPAEAKLGTVVNPAANPLMLAGRVALPEGGTAEQRRALAATLMAMLLGSKSAVLLEYGQELGLTGANPVMQWTPTNVTPKPAPPEPEPEPEKAAEPVAPPPPADVYGAFKEYVPPPPPKKKKPVPGPDEAPPPVDVATLPGFTAGELGEAAPADAATVNVAVEDADAHSLLNFTRKLVQYHHGNASLHNGTETVFNHDDVGAVAWLRRAPAGVGGTRSGTAGAGAAATILGVCNLSDKPVVLSLAEDLKALQLRPGTFRGLVTSADTAIFPQPYDRVTLPGYTVFLGELYH